MKAAERLTGIFFREGIISDDEREIVRFGLESMGGNLAGVIMTLVIGICFRHVKEALLLWVLLFPLRKNAGGFHAATRTRCFLVSFMMLVLSFAFFTVWGKTAMFYGISALATGGLIWLLAPVDNPSKKLDRVEQKVYRARSRMVLGAEGIILLFSLYFKWDAVTRSIAMAFFIVATSLSTGSLRMSKEMDFRIKNGN